MSTPNTTVDHSRISKWFPEMLDKADESLIAQKHSAMILSGGAPVSYGVNSMRGARPYHAEADVIRSFLISRGLLGYVKECRILRNSNQPKGEKSATQYQAIAIQC